MNRSIASTINQTVEPAIWTRHSLLYSIIYKLNRIQYANFNKVVPQINEHRIRHHQEFLKTFLSSKFISVFEINFLINDFVKIFIKCLYRSSFFLLLFLQKDCLSHSNDKYKAENGLYHDLLFIFIHLRLLNVNPFFFAVIFSKYYKFY